MLLRAPNGDVKFSERFSTCFFKGKVQGGSLDLGSLLVAKRNVEVQHGVSTVDGRNPAPPEMYKTL